MTNIVLTGFMGTGKTTIGRLVAEHFGNKFIDMDTEIEALAGKPIRSIFNDAGEATFRKMETDLCVQLSSLLTTQQNLVISTGGGTMVNPVNQILLAKNSRIVCLTCEVGELLRRLVNSDTPDRPLINVADQSLAIGQLLETRREIYAYFTWQIDTTCLTIEEVTNKVIKLADMVSLSVRYPGSQYRVYIGQEILELVGGVIQETGLPEGSQVAILSNLLVKSLYAEKVRKSLQSKGYYVFDCLIPDGERYKTLATVNKVYKQLLTGGLDRSGTVLALGGGVIGDIAGFVAATYMRGVRFIQLPTTLLAMVDASIGGKNGVDLPQGKNLVGTYKQPDLVMIDLSTLETLPVEELHSGMAEVIKHGIIAAPELFTALEEKNGSYSIFWETHAGIDWMRRAQAVKIDIVEQDPFEVGKRALLNLGHTVGHALEKVSKYELRHGEAVSIGMVAATHVAVSLGLASSQLAERIETALSVWGLPVKCPHIRCDDIIKAMSKDKKKKGKNLRWILPSDIGKVDICQNVPQKVVESVLYDLGAY
jgi:shikimate kinase/3-dehydroquinate synthase